MSNDRRTIKVSAEQFDRLKDAKPDGVTWGYYLTELRNLD